MHISDLKHENTSLKEKLEYLYSLRTGSKVNWDQAGYVRLLEALSNPQHNLPPVIHVAGTNGKGSIIAMLRSIYEAAGYKVHVYTSPHLIKVNERIILAGKMITDDRLSDLIDEALGYIGEEKLSFFEILTAIAFKAFSHNPADLLLLEVGMGGRLDCTNVIKNPMISIISQISLDHTEFLGDTLEAITSEKAGIIRPETPFVIGYQSKDSVVSLLKEKGQKSYNFGEDWSVYSNENEMAFTFKGQEHKFPLPALLGEHQIHNAGAALAAVYIAQEKFSVKHDHISAGLQNTKWPGRLERISFIKNHEIWLDCGHNDSAGQALAKELCKWKRENNMPIHLVLGMLNTKNEKAFIEPLLSHIDHLSIVPITNEPNSKSLVSYKDSFGSFGQASTFENVQQALTELTKQENPSRILIAGSVYLAGEVLQHYSRTLHK